MRPVVALHDEHAVRVLRRLVLHEVLAVNERVQQTPSPDLKQVQALVVHSDEQWSLCRCKSKVHIYVRYLINQENTWRVDNIAQTFYLKRLGLLRLLFSTARATASSNGRIAVRLCRPRARGLVRAGGRAAEEERGAVQHEVAAMVQEAERELRRRHHTVRRLLYPYPLGELAISSSKKY